LQENNNGFVDNDEKEAYGFTPGMFSGWRNLDANSACWSS
jgi:hypothetical protein